MKRALMLVLGLAVLAPAAAEAKGGGKKPRYDPSTDFSKQFDEDVKYERDHPKDDDGSPAPKKKRSSSSHRRRRKASSSADTQ